MFNTLEKGLLNFQMHEKENREKCFGGKMILWTDEGPVWFVAKCATLCLRLVVRIE
jgi:hypothetical protein